MSPTGSEPGNRSCWGERFPSKRGAVSPGGMFFNTAVPEEEALLFGKQGETPACREVAMTHQISFTQVENKLLPKFRQTISQARSTEDVKKMFGYNMQELFKEVSGGELALRLEDVALQPEAASYRIDDRIRELDAFTKVWNDTDLSRIVERFAELCLHQYAHLAKNPEKTEAKIRR